MLTSRTIRGGVLRILKSNTPRQCEGRTFLHAIIYRFDVHWKVIHPSIFALSWSCSKIRDHPHRDLHPRCGSFAEIGRGDEIERITAKLKLLLSEANKGEANVPWYIEPSHQLTEQHSGQKRAKRNFTSITTTKNNLKLTKEGGEPSSAQTLAVSVEYGGNGPPPLSRDETHWCCRH